MSKKTRKPSEGNVARHGPHGGVMTFHRFGTDGDWTGVTAGDIVAVAEVMMHVHGGRTAVPPCPDCDSIITALPDPDPADIGITHSPGCPWLAAAPSPFWQQT